jgi:hypothetical protein
MRTRALIINLGSQRSSIWTARFRGQLSPRFLTSEREKERKTEREAPQGNALTSTRDAVVPMNRSFAYKKERAEPAANPEGCYIPSDGG